MQKPTRTSRKAKKLALALLRENRAGRTWREISEQDYHGKVHFATLNRIAIHKGAWLPKDEAVLMCLGLITQRSPYAIMPRYFNRNPEALTWFLHKRDLVKGLSTETRQEVRRKPS
jgi:hypothetical protein